MDKSVIEARKIYSRLMKESRKQAKKQNCLWCDKKITSFCDSHSVPQCVLRNIDVEGKLDYFNTLLNIPFIDADKGMANAGIFNLICRECDGTIFRDYEDVNKLSSQPTEEMLEEIALKNILMMLNKRYFEIKLYDNMEKNNIPYAYEVKQKANSLDEKDFWYAFVRVKSMIEKKEGFDSKYKLFYWKKLNYVIPIAFQGLVTLYGDLDGKMVVDVYDNTEDMIVKHMHICMFPLEKSSVVFAFYHEDDTEYDRFAEQFQMLNEEEKLSILSYIVYEYCEDMLLAKKFPHRTWFNNKIKETFSDTSEIWAFDEEHAEYMKKIEMQKLKERDKNIPCILSEKFAVKTE